MAEQNQEAVHEALRQIKKIHSEISRASNCLWEVSQALDEQVKESQPSSLAAADSSSSSLESNVTPLSSNSVTTPDTDSAEQSSTSSDSSAPDSPIQPSKLEPTASQSNPIDLPVTNSLEHSLTSLSSKKKSTRVVRREKEQEKNRKKETEIDFFNSFKNLLNARFNEDEIEDLLCAIIYFKHQDYVGYKRINSQRNLQAKIRESMMIFQERQLFQQVIEYIKKNRSDIKLEEFLPESYW